MPGRSVEARWRAVLGRNAHVWENGQETPLVARGTSWPSNLSQGNAPATVRSFAWPAVSAVRSRVSRIALVVGRSKTWARRDARLALEGREGACAFVRRRPRRAGAPGSSRFCGWRNPVYGWTTALRCHAAQHSSFVHPSRAISGTAMLIGVFSRGQTSRSQGSRCWRWPWACLRGKTDCEGDLCGSSATTASLSTPLGAGARPQPITRHWSIRSGWWPTYWGSACILSAFPQACHW